MQSKKARLAILAAAALAAVQTAALASDPVIEFSPGGSTQTLPELTDTTSPTGNGLNQGLFTPAGGVNNILNVVGSDGSYVPGYVNDINNSASGDPSNYLKIGGFDPSTDSIFIALKLDNDGTPIPSSDTTDLDTIIGDINANASNPNVDGPLASLVTGQFLNVFNGYDILLSFPTTFDPASPARPLEGTPEQFDFGFNFTDYSDGGISDVTVTDIGLVPEPACLGLLSAAGLILLPRYRKRTV